MTDEMMSLRTLLEKSADVDLLREMVGFAAQRLMELEVESLTGAAHGERSPGRINHRNGYRDRDWETRAGAVELRIPKLRREATSRPFSNHAEWPKRRSPQSFKKPMSKACRPVRSTNWSRPWA